jgi:hypothetical protein
MKSGTPLSFDFTQRSLMIGQSKDSRLRGRHEAEPIDEMA